MGTSSGDRCSAHGSASQRLPREDQGKGGMCLKVEIRGSGRCKLLRTIHSGVAWRGVARSWSWSGGKDVDGEAPAAVIAVSYQLRAVGAELVMLDVPAAAADVAAVDPGTNGYRLREAKGRGAPA